MAYKYIFAAGLIVSSSKAGAAQPKHQLCEAGIFHAPKLQVSQSVFGWAENLKARGFTQVEESSLFHKAGIHEGGFYLRLHEDAYGKVKPEFLVNYVPSNLVIGGDDVSHSAQPTGVAQNVLNRLLFIAPNGMAGSGSYLSRQPHLLFGITSSSVTKLLALTGAGNTGRPILGFPKKFSHAATFNRQSRLSISEKLADAGFRPVSGSSEWLTLEVPSPETKEGTPQAMTLFAQIRNGSLVRLMHTLELQSEHMADVVSLEKAVVQARKAGSQKVDQGEFTFLGRLFTGRLTLNELGQKDFTIQINPDYDILNEPHSRLVEILGYQDFLEARLLSSGFSVGSANSLELLRSLQPDDLVGSNTLAEAEAHAIKYARLPADKTLREVLIQSQQALDQRGRTNRDIAVPVMMAVTLAYNPEWGDTFTYNKRAYRVEVIEAAPWTSCFDPAMSFSKELHVTDIQSNHTEIIEEELAISIVRHGFYGKRSAADLSDFFDVPPTPVSAKLLSQF